MSHLTIRCGLCPLNLSRSYTEADSLSTIERWWELSASQLLSTHWCQHYAHITVHKYLYGLPIFRHVPVVATTTIIRADDNADQTTSLLEDVCPVMHTWNISRLLQHRAGCVTRIAVFLFRGIVSLAYGGDGHRNMSEYSYALQVFFKCYICIVLDQLLDIDLIDMHGTSNVVMLTFTGRSRVRFSMLSLEFLIDIIVPASLWPWGWLSPLQKWVTKFFPGVGGKGGQCVGLTTLSPSCEHCLEIWEPHPPGTLRACPGL